MTLGPWHPETLAREATHADPARRAIDCGRAPTDPTGRRRSKAARARGVCTCTPDPDELAALWAGRARMARARAAAGVPLDAIDRQALDRAETAARRDAA